MPTITPYIYRAAAAITALVPVLLPSEGTKEKGRQPRQGLATRVQHAPKNGADFPMTSHHDQRRAALAQQAPAHIGH